MKSKEATKSWVPDMCTLFPVALSLALSLAVVGFGALFFCSTIALRYSCVSYSFPLAGFNINRYYLQNLVILERLSPYFWTISFKRVPFRGKLGAWLYVFGGVQGFRSP